MHLEKIDLICHVWLHFDTQQNWKYKFIRLKVNIYSWRHLQKWGIINELKRFKHHRAFPVVY